jgi:hypothetical protein
MRRFGFWSTTSFVLGLHGVALAATFLVSPGPGTPVQDAIDAAAPGDAIRLTLGYCNEDHLVVTKQLKIRGTRNENAALETKG